MPCTIASIASAAGPPSSLATAGRPWSPPSPTRGSSGILPRNGTPISRAIPSPPLDGKISVSSPHLGQTKPPMFSTTPITGSETLWQNEIDLRTAASATSWGVVTITAPSASSISWQTAIGSSPVPGGASTTR